MSGRSSTAGTRPADRPASTVRWGREASTDHSHEDGEGAVDAVLLTRQDPRTTRHRRVPATHGPATAPENCETRAILWVPRTLTRPPTSAFTAGRPYGPPPIGGQHDRPLWPSDSST